MGCLLYRIVSVTPTLTLSLSLSPFFVFHRSSFACVDFEIEISRKPSKLDGSQAGDNILERPGFSKDIKKLETGRTGVEAIRNGVGGSPGFMGDKKSGIDKVGVIGRMVLQDIFKIEKLLCPVSFKPSPIDIPFSRIDLIPEKGFHSSKDLGLD
jgi:hypothetical protein